MLTSALICTTQQVDLDLETIHNVETYSFKELVSSSEISFYNALLEETYKPLGFLCDKIKPREHTQRFGIFAGNTLAGICSLTSVIEKENLFSQTSQKFQQKRLIELGNVIVRPEYRGSVAFGLLLYESAKQAWQWDYDYIVGISRYQVLRYFVDFGVVPLLHEPLHLLGKENLMDFIIYYDTKDWNSVRYIEQRAKHYFNQEYVMAAIRQRWGNSKQSKKTG